MSKSVSVSLHRRRPQRSGIGLVVASLLVCQASLLAWAAARDTPGWDEVSHLVAGLSHWRFGTFDLYRVNPPLVRMVACIPVALSGPVVDWTRYDSSAGALGRAIREDFVRLNGRRTFVLVTMARLTVIPFCLVGAYVCFRWASDLYGDVAGLLALTLWVFDPNILGHGHMITPDTAAASIGLSSVYGFRKWLLTPRWCLAVAAGVLLGFAELTKTTWVVLFVLYPILWLAWRCCELVCPIGRRKLRGQALQLGAVLIFGLYVLNLGYCFEGSFTKLGRYEFVSGTLGGTRNPSVPDKVGNRFAGSWVSALPIPLPKNYLMGIDVQKSDFEIKMPSYLRGEWRMGGWWYYYLYALAVKEPLGTWILGFLTVGCTLLFWRSIPFGREEFLLVVPPVALLILVSSQTGFNHHLRYVLPVLPFVFVLVSQLSCFSRQVRLELKMPVAAAVMWSAASSLWVYPHSLSYFNELAGGPFGGQAHLGCVEEDSNLDWGQDLMYLKRWCDAHSEARPMRVAFSGAFPASAADIVDIELLPPNENAAHHPIRETGALEPEPGWFAVSVNRMHSRSGQYGYFKRFAPVAMAGYSIYIYHITPAEASRVRSEMGLQQLPMTRYAREGRR